MDNNDEEQQTPEQQNPEEQTPAEVQQEPDTFDRAYVESLRADVAKYRTRAKDAQGQAESLARQLFRLRVERNGTLADAEDFPFDQDLLGNDDKLDTAIDELVSRKPHLKARQVKGDVNQGNRSDSVAPADFSMLLRG